MKRTKQIEYNSCDLCDSEDKAVGKCDICDKYLCELHNRNFPWRDQMYQFCSEHLNVVSKIVEETGIPIGFIVTKLRGEILPSYRQDMWNKRGYEEKWKLIGEKK